jgi:hypothetical protein
MSDFSDTCDFFLVDLTEEINQLRDATLHRYAAWDPQRFTNDGDRHLAVWPAGEAETSEAFTTHGKLLRQVFMVAYWEPGDDEEERQVVDEEAAKDLLEVQNAMRARFFDLANQEPNTAVNYTATAFRESTSPVRGFLLTVTVDRPKDLI